MTDEERRKEKQKLYWFSATTQQDGQRRKPENMAPCAFGMLDIDGSTPGAITALVQVFRRYSMLVYQTASYTTDEPRLRIVCELSRAVESDYRRATGESIETLLMQEADSHSPARRIRKHAGRTAAIMLSLTAMYTALKAIATVHTLERKPRITRAR